MELAPAQDDEVLAAAGDIQLAVEQEPEVAGAKPARVDPVQRSRTEDFGIALGRPVARRYARAADPDLADRCVGHRMARCRIDDRDRGAGLRSAAGHERDAVACRDESAGLQRLALRMS